MSSDENKPPSVGIKEALRLFLALASPGGMPEGVDEDALLDVLEAKVASDRPEWARASERVEPQAPEPQPDGEPPQNQQPESQQAYSQLKAHIAEQARSEEVPEDPDEKYFYERKKGVEARLRERREEERQARIRAALQRRLIAEKRSGDSGNVSIDRVLHIRRALEQQLRPQLERALQPDAPQIEREAIERGVRNALNLDARTAPRTDADREGPRRVSLGHTLTASPVGQGQETPLSVTMSEPSSHTARVENPQASLDLSSASPTDRETHGSDSRRKAMAKSGQRRSASLDMGEARSKPPSTADKIAALQRYNELRKSRLTPRRELLGVRISDARGATSRDHTSRCEALESPEIGEKHGTKDEFSLDLEMRRSSLALELETKLDLDSPSGKTGTSKRLGLTIKPIE